MKKSAGISALFLFAISLIPFVSAQMQSIDSSVIKGFVMDVIDNFLAIFSPIFELLIGPYSATEFFFAKILLLFLLIIICKFVLDKTPLGEGNKKISFLISIIVSLLAIRFINENNLIGGILVPYGTLGIAMTTILPFLIFFYFVHRSGVGTFGRKFFWIMFVIILIVLWISKFDKISEVSNWIFGLVLLSAVILLIFDKSVHSYLGIGDLRRYERDSNKRRIWKAKKELDELEEHFEKRRLSFSEYREEKKRLRDYIKELSREH